MHIAIDKPEPIFHDTLPEPPYTVVRAHTAGLTPSPCGRGERGDPIKINLTDHWPLLYGKQVGPASTARREYVPSYQNEIARKNQSFPRAKLGTAYRNWPRHTGGTTSRAQHRGAVLAVAQLRVKTYPQPVTQHVGRQDQQCDTEARKDRQPPSPFHQRLALLGHHQTPGGLRRRHPHAQEAQRRLDDHGHPELQAKDHHHRVHDIGNDMPPDDAELTDAVDLRQLHKVPLA